jgi:hypothetical protein
MATNVAGEIYVADDLNQRVDKFEESGKFVTAWGWGVNEASRALELQACATYCTKGEEGSGAGQFNEPQGVAVDNDPLSASYGDVYVANFSGNNVEKFGPSGEFILMLGGHVNEMTGGNVCLPGEACRKGTEGTVDGEFEWAYKRSYIAVGPGGDVYVGDRARVQVFEPSGAWKESVSLSGLSSTGKVTALAVDGAGDMYVKDSEAAGVRVFEPSGVEEGFQFDAGSTSVEQIALDVSGDLFVSDSGGGVHFLEYDPSGKELASFGSKTLSVAHSIAFSDARGALYAYGEAGSESGIWILTPPSQGPLVEPSSESVTVGMPGIATLEATVNPEGSETTYRIEYVDEAHYQANGFASASSTPAVSIGSSFEDQLARVELTELAPGATYQYRVVATSSEGTAIGSDESFEATPSALVEGPSATNVAGTSATLGARINPLGASTGYRLEYGTSISYGHVLSGNVGERIGYVPVSCHVQELESNTTYHYRLVTTSEVGTVEGADHTFTTQSAGGELTLPDGRAWELVSPADKKGALIEPFEVGAEIQAASGGSGITYLTAGAAVGENPAGKLPLSQVLSMRGPDGWSSEDLTLPHRLPENGAPAVRAAEVHQEYLLFSPDLSLAAVQPQGHGTPPLSPEATERTLYLRDDLNGSFSPLVTPANVPPGTTFGGEGLGRSADEEMQFLAATPDLRSHDFISALVDG